MLPSTKAVISLYCCRTFSLQTGRDRKRLIHRAVELTHEKNRSLPGTWIVKQSAPWTPVAQQSVSSEKTQNYHMHENKTTNFTYLLWLCKVDKHWITASLWCFSIVIYWMLLRVTLDDFKKELNNMWFLNQFKVEMN